MRCCEPGEPDGKEVFADAERPIAERFRDTVGGGARTSFCAVRSERNSASEKRGDPAPFGGDAGGNSEGENGRCGRTDESVDEIPDRVEVRDFVGEKLEDVKADGEAENDGVREHV